MTLTAFQRARFRSHLHAQADVRDTSGSPIDLEGGGAAPFVGCRATLNANQSVVGGIEALAWNGTDTFDTSAIHDSGTDPSRFTIPADLDGWWRYTVHVNGITTSGSQSGVLQLYKNGEWVHSLDERVFVSGTVHGFLATDTLSLVAGDYIEIYFGTGASSTWRANASGSYMTMEFLGAAA